MCGETSREPPRRNAASQFPDAKAAVEIDKVDGELHPERVHCLAGYDPQPRSRLEALAPQKALAAPGAAVGNFNSGGEYGLTGEVSDLHGHMDGYHFSLPPLFSERQDDATRLRADQDLIAGEP